MDLSPRGLTRKVAGALDRQDEGFNRQGKAGFGGLGPYGYNSIPYDLRRQHGFDPSDNYYYGNGYIYQVDPRALIVEQVIQALLR